jgi:type II secretory pathway pseudopilin PulG
MFTVLKTHAFIGLIYASLSIPGIASCHAAIMEDQFRLRATACNLAISAYAQEHGQLPPDLSTLMTNAPLDPFLEDQTLKYRSENNLSWIIYSVGFDQIDDHGTPIPKERPKNQSKLDQKGDLVISGSVGTS